MEPFTGEIDLKENLNIPNKKHPTNLGKIKCGLITIGIFLILLLICIIFLSFYKFEIPNQEKKMIKATLIRELEKLILFI